MNLIRDHHSGVAASDQSHGNELADRGAPFWVRYYDLISNLITLGKTRTIHRQTLSLVDLQAGEAVLDVGCGTGVLLMEAEKIVGGEGVLVGLDVEAEMIRQARRRAGKNNSRATFEAGSIDQIPYPDKFFDVTISSLVYHHLSESEKLAGLQELARVLKPDGRLIIVDLNPSQRSIFTSLPGHNRLDRQDYVLREVPERMGAAGFVDIEAGPHPSRKLSYAIGRKRG